jgi:hypothetical protein
MAALGHHERDLVSRAIAEPFGNALQPLRGNRKNDLVGDEQRKDLGLAFGTLGERRSVVLREKGSDDLVVGNLGSLDGIRRDIGKAAAAHEQDRNLHELALAVQSDDVSVAVIDGDDALLGAHLFDRPELIAVGGRELVARFARGLLHFGLELARELVVPAVEKLRHRFHLRGVPPCIDRQDARRGAPFDLVLQARPLPPGKLCIAARTKLEVLVDEMKRAARRGGRVIRAKITRAVRRRPPHDFEPRPADGIRVASRRRHVVVVRIDRDDRARPRRSRDGLCAKAQRNEVFVVA